MTIGFAGLGGPGALQDRRAPALERLAGRHAGKAVEQQEAD